MQKNEGGPLLYTTKKHEFGMDKILIRSGNLKFLKESRENRRDGDGVKKERRQEEGI